MSDTRKIMAILTAKPGKAAELEALLFGMAPHVRAEPANLRFDVWRDQSDPDRFALDELYQGSAGVDAHLATAHFKDYRSRIEGLAERVAVILKAADVA